MEFGLFDGRKGDEWNDVKFELSKLFVIQNTDFFDTEPFHGVYFF